MSSNRSLERGLAVLECFRPGVGFLSHSEIVERTGLPKATISRLIASLTSCGYLVYEPRARSYCLGVPVLSLARCFKLESRFTKELGLAIERLAHATRTIIGFGTAHGTDIVYLEATNGDPDRATRQVGPGMRAPILSTSVGHAYLAGLLPSDREIFGDYLGRTSREPADALRSLIDSYAREVSERGFCTVQYAQGTQAAIGIPVPMSTPTTYALGIGYGVPGCGGTHDVPQPVLDAATELLNVIRQADRRGASGAG